MAKQEPFSSPARAHLPADENYFAFHFQTLKDFRETFNRRSEGSICRLPFAILHLSFKAGEARNLSHLSEISSDAEKRSIHKGQMENGKRQMTYDK